MIDSITFQGNPMTLLGRGLRENVPAPDFTLSDGDLNSVTLKDFEDKIKVLTTFPSLDTPVCDLQVRSFNQRATELDENVAVIAISKDLPFAQKRFCSANTIDHVLVFSDFRNGSFGANYGLTIAELNLLARAVIILDSNNIIRYVQIVPELTDAPDYVSVYDALEDVVKNPALSIDADSFEKCKACEGVAPLIEQDKIEEAMKSLNEWKYEDGTLVLDIKTADYGQAVRFLNVIAHAAEEQNHHPSLCLDWNRLKVTLKTHSAGGVTENDFIMARIISSIIKQG